MTDTQRDFENLTDYLLRATHEQLGAMALALGRELLMRGLPGDTELLQLAHDLRRSRSTPRAEPFARPR